MDITVTKRQLEEIPGLAEFGKKYNDGSFELRYYSSCSRVDLGGYTVAELAELRAIYAPHTHVRGVQSILRDIDVWVDVSQNKSKTATAKGKNVQQIYSFMIQYLSESPRQHIYKTIDAGDTSVVLCYWIERLEYHPPGKSKEHGRIPPWFTMHGVYEEFDRIHKVTFHFSEAEVLGKSCLEILRQKNLSVETPILRGDYEVYVSEYFQIHQNIGEQYLAVGVADDSDIDGNPKKSNSAWSISSLTESVRLDKDGVPSRVVIDVFRETDSAAEHRRGSYDSTYSYWFWSSRQAENRTKGKEDDDDENLEMTDDDVAARKFAIEIPVHPYVVCFDLKRHIRLRIHVGNLTKYVYDESLRDNLVLPPAHTKLIDTLLSKQTRSFVDVVKNKSGGVIILCQGAPGTGKTLTAEIYAESQKRPLYTVQCSQLGVKVTDLEENLVQILARGKRWNAVLLLDEADVYVHQRGSDLEQNAIVGVFLRVLEYHTGVLFLTTNRGDMVDDAILSRCTARITYKVPSTGDQKKIWKNLCAANKIDISDEVIDDIVLAHNDLSGRDIKNLLKLASMVAASENKMIDSSLISEMKLFKPTSSDFV